MACSVYASPIAAHQSSVVLRPPRRAGVRPASPYARASSLPRTRLRPLSLSLSLNIPLCAMASVSAPELCSSGTDINPRVRRHGYSASAPSSINSPSKELSDCPTSTSTSTYSTLASDDYSTSSPDCASAASSSKFPACVSSYAAYPVPASAVTQPANHSPYPIFTSNLDSASSFAASSSPSSPVSASSSVYYSCPASAVTSPVSANWTTSPFTPFSPHPPWSTSASSNSRWPTSPYVPPPLSSLSTHFQSPPSTRSPSPSPILFSSPPFPHPSPLDARTPPSFSHITPHIAIADLAFAESADLLEREGVTHVVSVLRERSHIPSCIPPSNRLHVPLDDAPFAELVGHLSPIVQWVKDVLEGAGVIGAGNDPHAEQDKSLPQPPTRILIHCAHGISRSPAVGAALLVALPLIDAGEADLSEVRREDEDGRLSQNHTRVEDDAMEVSSPTTSWTSPARQCTSPASFSFLASPPSPVRESTPRPSPTPSPTPTIRVRSPSRLARPSLPLFIPPSAPAASAPSPLRPTPPPPPLLAVPPPTASSPTSTVAGRLPFATPSSSSLPLPPPPAPVSASPQTVKRTLSAPAALAYVSARRPAADVNWGFRAQLSEWEGVCRRKSDGAATL